MDLAGDERSQFPTAACAETLQNLLPAPLLFWVGSLFAEDVLERTKAEKSGVCSDGPTSSGNLWGLKEHRWTGDCNAALPAIPT